jgi:hypothetical protein
MCGINKRRKTEKNMLEQLEKQEGKHGAVDCRDKYSFTFLGVFVYIVYLCRPSEASTRYCVIPGGYPPQD